MRGPSIGFDGCGEVSKVFKVKILASDETSSLALDHPDHVQIPIGLEEAVRSGPREQHPSTSFRSIRVQMKALSF